MNSNVIPNALSRILRVCSTTSYAMPSLKSYRCVQQHHIQCPLSHLTGVFNIVANAISQILQMRSTTSIQCSPLNQILQVCSNVTSNTLSQILQMCSTTSYPMPSLKSHIWIQTLYPMHSLESYGCVQQHRIQCPLSNLTDVFNIYSMLSPPSILQVCSNVISNTLSQILQMCSTTSIQCSPLHQSYRCVQTSYPIPSLKSYRCAQQHNIQCPLLNLTDVFNNIMSNDLSQILQMCSTNIHALSQILQMRSTT